MSLSCSKNSTAGVASRLACSKRLCLVCHFDVSQHGEWTAFCFLLCFSVANKDCTCLVTTYNQLRKLWENKDKQKEMSYNPSHHNGAGPCSLHAGEGPLHASMYGSNSSLGWLPPFLFCVELSVSLPAFAYLQEREQKKERRKGEKFSLLSWGRVLKLLFCFCLFLRFVFFLV